MHCESYASFSMKAIRFSYKFKYSSVFKFYLSCSSHSKRKENSRALLYLATSRVANFRKRWVGKHSMRSPINAYLADFATLIILFWISQGKSHGKSLENNIPSKCFFQRILVDRKQNPKPSRSFSTVSCPRSNRDSRIGDKFLEGIFGFPAVIIWFFRRDVWR